MDEIAQLYGILESQRRLPRMPPMRRDLLFWMEEPKAYVHATGSVLVIKEKHPKAEMHFLVLPKKDIPSIRDVKKEDLGLLREMDKIGRFIATIYGGERKFWHCHRFGYHAFQMQKRLHLHVISNDLCGTGMNTIWHWNSFTTPFFLKSEEVVGQLGKRGLLKLPTLRECLGWLNGPFYCHFCTYAPCDVYILKDHVKEHFNGSDFFHLVPRVKGAKSPSYCPKGMAKAKSSHKVRPASATAKRNPSKPQARSHSAKGAQARKLPSNR